MSIRTRSATLPNGVRLDYAEHGDPRGTPVLLLHGVTDSWRSFQSVLPHLPASLRAVALTQRGHGDSDRPETGYRPEELAADVAGFIAALGLGPVILAGHSMGGSVALRCAVEYPDRLRALMLAGARASWRGHPDIVEMWDAELAGMTDPVDPAFVRAFQESTLARPIAPGFLDMAVRESLKLPARIWQALFRDAVLGADDGARLGRVTAPTLVLCGDRDTLAYDAQAALAAGISGARRATYAGAGHALHWEEPARFAADLAAFADSLVGADLLSR